ncbi:hypothetical protein H7T43_13355 [Peribacillus simplex]|nr:hypothetical protein [Peribacillus simplex]
MAQPDFNELERSEFPYNISFIKFQLIGTEGTRLLRGKRGQGDPAGERRGGSRTARGKRVPGVEIITHTPFRKSAPFPPTDCQAS